MAYTYVLVSQNALILIVLFAVASGQKKCDDVSSTACQKFLQINPNMCNDTCYANLCKETCGYCPLTCFHCNEVDAPEQCTSEVQCEKMDQLCLATQRLTPDLHTFFTSGCAERRLCDNLFNFSGKRTAEKSERSYHLHGGCCDYDHCNIHDSDNTTVTPDPSSTRPPRPAGGSVLLAPNSTMSPNLTCSPRDVDSDACLILSISDPNICQKTCVAEMICPAMCGTCLQCYECDRVNNPADCQKLVTCDRYKKCVAVKLLGADFSIGYKLGCIDPQTCESVFNQSPAGTGSIGKRQFQVSGKCCSTNSCNQDVFSAPGK